MEMTKGIHKHFGETPQYSTYSFPPKGNKFSYPSIKTSKSKALVWSRNDPGLRIMCMVNGHIWYDVFQFGLTMMLLVGGGSWQDRPRGFM